jgi:hypothetical protein
VLVKDDGGEGKSSSTTKKKLKMLENELEIKTTALREVCAPAIVLGGGVSHGAALCITARRTPHAGPA